MVAERGAGSATSSNAGAHRKGYQSGQPSGLHPNRPTIDATSAIATPVGTRHRSPACSVPRNSAAATTIGADAANRSVSSHESQSPGGAPRAGGVIPRANAMTSDGDASRSTIAAASPYQRRGNRRSHSHTPPSVSSPPASPSAPADPESGPRIGRKKVAGEKSACAPSAAPIGARAASQTTNPRTT